MTLRSQSTSASESAVFAMRCRDYATLKAQITSAIALLETAASLLAAADREGPRGDHSIAKDVVAMNKRIHAMQAELLAAERALDRKAAGLP